MNRILFARIGWMRLYRGPQSNDEKPIGGGKYNQTSLGHEAYNFLPSSGEVLGYFQPMLPAANKRKANPSHVALERIEAGFTGDSLSNVLAVFVATDPVEGGQRIVGWFKSASVYRFDQDSNLSERQSFSYYIRAKEENAKLVVAERRHFRIPHGKGGFGQANVCYALNEEGNPKENTPWMQEALNYINDYELENAAQDPITDVDAAIDTTLSATLERAAGFQSNPRIRKTIENYAMQWAHRFLKKEKYAPKDTHANKPYDFVCEIDGKIVYVEVKGMQDSGTAVSLTPREVEHAQAHPNSALFIVHSVTVKGRRRPVVSGGIPRFIYPWDIYAGTLKPRGFVLTLND